MAEINLYEVSAAAREKAAAERGIRAKGYEGKTRFFVTVQRRVLTVFASDAVSALYAAAEHLGMDPRKAEFHQSCRVRKC